ncbi:MAG: dihydrolipoyl dehydrogenase [Parachlamydiales bacterium]|jgi:dihydrolipoamide dehydrogenase
MDKKLKFDIVVLGSGTGGYPAAIRAAQAGKSVALIEPNELGGTCLNRGCIPSKALIATAELLHRIEQAEDFGIKVGPVTYDYSKMIDRKDKVVGNVRKGLEGLIKSNNITLFRGYGKLSSKHEIRVNGKDNAVIEAEKIIVATGSEPKNIPAFPCDNKKILDSTALLELRKLPKKIVIIGGGVIGCEFASLFNAFNVEVVIVEMLSSILPMEGAAVSATLTKAYERKGIKIHTGAKVLGIDDIAEGVSVRIQDKEPIAADIALVAVGRSLNVRNIGLENVGVLIKDNGIVEVNEHMQTSVENIYAVGDISSTLWLAHVASHQGIVAARHATGDAEAVMHYNAVPSVIFTTPEIGTVGLSLEKALEQGYQAALGSFPFTALGKSQATIQTEGFAQVVFDKKTHQILGAQVVGHEASALIAEMAVAVANELTLESITETIHAHPTIAEAWLEAALIANNTPLHLPPKKK